MPSSHTLAIELPEPARDVADGPTVHDVADAPKVHYLALENEEKNQISITSGNLALYEVPVCLSVCLL